LPHLTGFASTEIKEIAAWLDEKPSLPIINAAFTALNQHC